MKEYPQRKNPRIKGYDYATPGYYFVTICTYEKMRYFGMPQRLNALGKLAQKAFSQIPEHFQGVHVDKFVVMPNHVHAIIVIEEYGVSLSTIVGAYKSYVTREVHKIKPDIKLWQVSFHDHGIRDQRGYEKIWEYIDTNPLKWESDCFYV